MLAVAGTLVAYDVSRAGEGMAAPPAGPARVGVLDAGVPNPDPSAPPLAATPAPDPGPSIDVVHSGPGSFDIATGSGPVLGRAGQLHRFRVAVERGIGIAAASFAASVEAILADGRGWTAGGTARFQRVPAGAPAEFTVHLATPVTSETICREGRLETEQFTNCRLGSGKVVINLARWLTAVPDYGAPLAVYQAYAVNHEVGHQLGQWHELCPGPGRPAPVMQQQTLGLQGCVANSWPYLDGVRYRGAPTPA